MKLNKMTEKKFTLEGMSDADLGEWKK